MKNDRPAWLANKSSGIPPKSPVRVVSDASFEREVVQSDLPVFVDFWAPWCGPCKMIAPVVEALAEEYKGRIKFVKLDTEANPGVPGQMGIKSIPTMLVFKGRDVAVVGGGSTAVEDAIYLARLCRKVTLVHRRDELRAEKVIQEQLFRLPNVEVVWNTVISALRSDGVLTGLDLLDRKTGETVFLPVAALFVAVGQDPGSAQFQDLLELDGSGYIVTDALLHTKQPGIFAAGDVRTTALRQIVTAMSDGALAVAQAAHYLNVDGLPRP